ncbi:MAG: ComF family protein [bacterium]
MHELEGVRAAFEMDGTARRLVHELKYRYYRAAAPVMAQRMGKLADGLAIDSYFAVPLHRSREKERGFNQSRLLLEAAAWAPQGPGLKRTRRTERQVGQALGDRRANVTDAFAYSGPRLDGLTVALIDDVVTTGATAAECGRVLKDAGARTVWVLAFARASYRPETSEPIED